MTCICGHPEKAHAQDVGLCGSPHGCNCNQFRKAPAVHDGLSMDGVHRHKAVQDAMWLSAEWAIHTALIAVTELQKKVPEDVAHTPARNRMTMAAMHLEDARDRMAAARARLPKEG